MNAEQAVEKLKTGARITYANSDTGIFYRMCHGDKIIMLNAEVCPNGITAQIDAVLTIKEFLDQCRWLGNVSFKNYEEN